MNPTTMIRIPTPARQPTTMPTIVPVLEAPEGALLEVALAPASAAFRVAVPLSVENAVTTWVGVKCVEVVDGVVTVLLEEVVRIWRWCQSVS
jgi:hypothetical protein